jgi:hypothetical protein
MKKSCVYAIVIGLMLSSVLPLSAGRTPQQEQERERACEKLRPELVHWQQINHELGALQAAWNKGTGGERGKAELHQRYQELAREQQANMEVLNNNGYKYFDCNQYFRGHLNPPVAQYDLGKRLEYHDQFGNTVDHLGLVRAGGDTWTGFIIPANIPISGIEVNFSRTEPKAWGIGPAKYVYKGHFTNPNHVEGDVTVTWEIPQEPPIWHGKWSLDVVER